MQRTSLSLSNSINRFLRNVSHRASIPLRKLRQIILILFSIVLGIAVINSKIPGIFFSKSKLHLSILSPRKRTSTIEIFTAPPQLTPYNIPRLRSTITSWRALRPRPAITLLGRNRGLPSFAKSERVNYDARIDQNFLGRPLFNSMVILANQSKADIAVFINSDVILLNDFAPNLQKLHKKLGHFFAVGARYDIDHIPDVLRQNHADLRQHILSHGELHNYGGMDFWAWTTGGPRLVKEKIPTFVYARGRYDNWLMHEVVSHGARPVVDLSETVVSVHPRHDYNNSLPPQAVSVALAPSRVQERMHKEVLNSKSTSTSNFWSRGKLSNFELFLNIHLSLSQGSYRNGFGTTRHAPWKTVNCFEPDELCLLKRMRPGICVCEYSPNILHTQMGPRIDNQGRPKYFEVAATDENVDQYTIPVRITRDSARHPHFGLPLTFLDALATVMRNGTLVITAVNFAYRHVMMTWVCQLRRLGIQNFVVAALDEELYKFAFARGVAVYYEDSFGTGYNIMNIRKEGVYGTDHFMRLTKLKTRIVLRILRLGYDVLWSDCDIVFFRNPLPVLLRLSGDMLIQSNAPDNLPANRIRRMNSGFYLARASQKLVDALDRVVELAFLSNLTEQPFFYDVLCGPSGIFRVGKSQCIHKGLETVLLDRELFPNGITQKMWDTRPGEIRSKFPNALILHNNWVSGLETKEKRMRQHGFDIFLREEDVCDFDSFGVPSTGL